MTTSVPGADAERASLAASVESIRQQIAACRPDLSESTATYRAAVLLLLGPQLRFNIDRMSSRTRYPRAQVAAFARRLFDHGVWQPTGPDYRWSSCNAEEFWRDVAVAEGRLCRRTTPSGKVEWAEPGTWTKAYDFVTKDASLTVSYVDAQPAPAPGEDIQEEEAAGSAIVVGGHPATEAVRRAPALATVANGNGKYAGVAVGNGTVRPKWTRTRPSDLFPDAQWLS